MKKKIIIIGIAAIVVIAFVLANVLKKEKGIEVDVEKVEQGTLIQKVAGSGQIQPEVQVKISSRVAGKILKLHAKEGDRVKKNQLLVELDQEQYIAALERSQSSLLSMQASEKKMKSDLERAVDLHNKGLVSQAEFEATQASYEAAVSNKSQAQAAVREARDQLSKTRLYSDMDGVVTRLNKEEGEMTLGSQFQEDVIMIVADLSRMEAAIEVDENDVINISLGDSAAIEVDAFGDTTLNGKVTEIANSATIKNVGTQEQVTNFEVIVALQDYNAKLRPGMSTTVDIVTEVKSNVLKVPIQAVTVREKEKLEKRPGVEQKVETETSETASTGSENKAAKDKENLKEVVFCVEENKAVVKPLQLGISDDTHYEVISGLEAGQSVVTGPFRVLSKTLKDGDLLTVKQESKKESKAGSGDQSTAEVH
jgi:HlyD family secretion protein